MPFIISDMAVQHPTPSSQRSKQARLAFSGDMFMPCIISATALMPPNTAASSEPVHQLKLAFSGDMFMPCIISAMAGLPEDMTCCCSMPSSCCRYSGLLHIGSLGGQYKLLGTSS